MVAPRWDSAKLPLGSPSLARRERKGAAEPPVLDGGIVAQAAARTAKAGTSIQGRRNVQSGRAIDAIKASVGRVRRRSGTAPIPSIDAEGRTNP